MKTTSTELIDAYKARKGLRSDLQAAKALGLGTGSVYRYRRGSTMDLEIARKICRALGYDLEYYAARLEADKQISPERKKVWLAIAKRLSSTAAAVVVGIALLSPIITSSYQYVLC